MLLLLKSMRILNRLRKLLPIIPSMSSLLCIPEERVIMLPQKRTGLERKIVTKKRYADMGNNSRKQHGPEFKAKVALEALKEQATLPELEKKFGVSQYTISRWKNELLRNASQTFGATNDEEAHQKEVDNLHRKIGELEMMLDFAKRASRKLGVRLPEDL